MTTRIKLRRDTAANWASANPVLALGEPGYDTTNNKLKIGDGVTAWQDLDYLTDETGGGGSLSVGNGTDPSINNVTEILINGTITEIEPGLVGVSVSANTGQINFDGTDIYGPSNEIVSMYAQDGDDNIRASLRLDPGDGYPVARLQTSYPNNSTFYDDAWTGSAQWIANGGGGRIDFTSETLKNFLQNTLVYCDNITIEVNGQNAGAYYGANTGPGYVQFNVQNPPVESPDTVVEIRFNYDEIGKVVLDHNDSSLEIDGGTGLEVRLKTRQGISLQANSKNWNFGTDGHLILPNGGDIRNTSGDSVLGGNTGIVAFDSYTTSAGIYNSQGGEVIISNFSYVTAEAETAFVRIPAGDSTDQLRVVQELGEVLVQANNQSWTFGTDGWLSFPGTFPSGAIGYDSDTQTLQLARFGGVSLYSQAGAWVFGQDGNLQLPPNGDIVDSNGDSVLNAVANITDDKEVKITVGNTEYWAIINRANNNDDGVDAGAVAYDSDDNMVTLHISEIYVDPNNKDILVVSKFDTSANLLWQKQFVQDVDSRAARHDVCFDDDDNIIIAASVDNGVDLDTVNLIKLSTSGSIIWQKQYRGNETVGINYPGLEPNSNTINEVTYNGSPAQSVIVFGVLPAVGANWQFMESTDNTNFNSLGTTIGAIYSDNDGTTTIYFAPGTLTAPLDYPTKYYRLSGNAVNSQQDIGAVVYHDGSVFLAGWYDPNDDGGDFDQLGLLIKVDATDGSVDYAITFGLPGGAPRIIGMDVGPDGDPVIVGYAEIDGPVPPAAFAAKLNGTDGSHIWTRLLFDPVEGTGFSGGDVVVDGQNNVFVSINANQAIAHENGNSTYVTIAHLMKLNSSGTVQWTRRIGPGPCASVGTGIDCDSSGNIYLSALTVAQKNPGRDYSDFATEGTRNVLAVAKYSTSGTVLWQRYIEPEGYRFTDMNSTGNTDPGNFQHLVNRGRFLSLNNSGKLAVQVTARQLDADDYTWDSTYTESITFQIDQDGREMTVGSGVDKFTVKESRIPGKLVTLTTQLAGPGDVVITDLTGNLSANTSTLTLEDGILAQQISKSAPYEYVFGNDGTFTVPNDGDIRLVQTQIGWFSVFGPANNTYDNIDIRCSVVDPASGDVYVAGESDDSSQGFVARYNRSGEILWSIRLVDNDNGNNNRCNAIKLHPTRGNVLVLCEYYGAQTGTLMVEIDPDTARVVNSLGFRDENQDGVAIAYDFDFFTNGDVAVVGRKSDEFKTISVVPQDGSGFSNLIILNSATASNAVHPVTNSWYVTGTGITGRASVQYVNRYLAISGTTRAGSGATFNVVANDGDPGVYSFALVSGGTNYRTGHKVKILGSTLGGVDGTNDLIITVSNVINGVIESISLTYEGTANGGALTNYNGVSGTAHQLGSGATFNVTVNDDGTIAIDTISAAGTNYVENDYITILGTVFAGGTAPENNLSLVVGSVSVGGVSTISSGSGFAPTTHRKIEISDSVDFSDEGSWSVGYNLGGECFVIRYSDEIEWSKVLSAGGQGDTERYLSVAVDASDNVYAAGEMISRGSATVLDLQGYWCAVTTKLSGLGVHQWTKALNTTLDDSYAKCVSVRGNVVAVSHQNTGSGDTVITKLDTNGNVKWQRTTDSADDSSVAVDTNGDIYAVVEANFENKFGDCIKVIRFAANGEVIYRKFFGTVTGQYGFEAERFKNGRNLTLDADHLYVSGYTYIFADNYRNGFLTKLPKTGDFDGFYGVWAFQVETYDVDPVTSTEATAFTPNVGAGNWELWVPDFTVNWWDPSDDNYYQTLQEIRDRDGGAIEFADGTRQTSSAQQIPQRKIRSGADHRLTLEDMGKHIYVINNSNTINIPYHYDNPLPIGFTVVIVNNSGGTVNIDADGGGIDVIQPGNGNYQYWDLSNPGMATLLKVDNNTWFITGNVTDD